MKEARPGQKKLNQISSQWNEMEKRRKEKWITTGEIVLPLVKSTRAASENMMNA